MSVGPGVADPPSSPLQDLKQELAGRGNQEARVSDLLRLIGAVEQTFEEIGRHRDTLAETVAFVNALQERLMIVDDLPAEAPFGALIRRRNGTVGQKATLYTGNGTGEPLARIVPQPL